MHKSLKIGMTAGALGALVALGGIAPAQAADDVAKLSVLHGVPGLTVDVYVNDKLTLDDFKPGDLAGPLDLAAGTYKVAITASDATDASAPVIGPVDLPLEAGKNYTAAAHLQADGKPTATLFTNDISQLAAGEGRLTVRHVAAAPAVDVLANGAAAITNLVNPNESMLVLPAGTISAAVAATGTTDPVIGPADVNVAEGTNTIVYAWGSLTDKNLALAVQTINGLHSNPDSIPAGEGGLVATNQTGKSTGLMVGGFAALMMGLVAAAVVGMRRAAGARR
ncbi:DUF4397 domain-containing protein [Cryobacterium sp. TMT1-21]|uniref:DUF4397 domain-containing protein n=1 Tax=Cryobacterium shii TaxID=1259235 RepID=A0AAQ2HEH5_9MICO|nr:MULTISPECIES: DUF4397 domain-containing protein [Cryobacterium]TFC41949.1 DUF4397 domain-containing protein [Cryobacterium shii]TFC87369.1 DUF4397 domain-containing protein [Cryobacterium sp. TmT2-59]TFD17195.1 DUF4397 domain-containing protein [Cryobacterium sp. TMT1-21]TFD26391.1 DUF4397 domain-containing protein [Cryobacterium sp. TMT2-23]TFD37082.1 DUF4397 domain-containing protein [Cryobacterium sp. TMT2-10]